MMPSQIGMLGSLLVGLAATLGTIVIHGFVFHAMVMNLHNNLQRGVLGARLWVNLAFIIGAVLRALVGHLGEIALWAFALAQRPPSHLYPKKGFNAAARVVSIGLSWVMTRQA
jgi:hypothetical protein